MHVARLVAVLLLALPAGAVAAGPSALVWRTEHGIPHIVADDDAVARVHRGRVMMLALRRA